MGLIVARALQGLMLKSLAVHGERSAQAVRHRPLEHLAHAGVAQLVEQLIRNEKVEGSIPFSGTKPPFLGQGLGWSLHTAAVFARSP
jgi:hypothetical protein